LTTLTNVQNSLFVPDLGRWLNRRPTYTLTRPPSSAPAPRLQEPGPHIPTEPKVPEELDGEPVTKPPTVQRSWSWQRRPPVERSHSISSVLSDSHFAVLPHGETLEGWSEEDKEALDDHVRHMLHSRRSKFKQRMRAFGKYVSKRKSHHSPQSNALLTSNSTRFRCDILRILYHHVWIGVGFVPHR
jgi:hypothetical protein